MSAEGESPLDVDLHIHSRFSPDSRSRPEDIVKRATALGLGAIAVTDHGSLEGARAAAKFAPDLLLVVPGMELKTEKGDLLALFVSHKIRSNIFATAVDEIRAQGGIAIVPHPANSRKMTKQDIALADGLEVFNSTRRSSENKRALAFATDLKMPGFSFSDAHMVREIGKGTTRVRDCSSLEELRKRLLTNPTVSNMMRPNMVIHRLNHVLVFGLKGLWRRQ